ncbi:glycoside hydrolase family 1 protein [Pseudobutyrivibrio sp.]|uniref:glycoside hydrolase family 1 protein n=1 Tax=Pseudobutyrivibrio sp. TaxID=2014367 RepID=UPI001D3DC3E8|nr:family 1 glycosylhydrolase [Pseudobutyrivibrio sp.]MBE5910423.1 glycoside hydrolase family 1 protein [Pseudobutyrivibrio sp.]
MSFKFDKDFMLGASTAAHQVEGNNTNSDYWVMENMEYTQFVEPSDDACDHYNKYEEDIKMLAEAGLNTYRFSIEWARIEPEQGHFDEKEVEHYRDVIKCCKENGIEPVVTLMHFTSPIWLIKMGGWDNEQVIDLFANYARYITEQLGDELNYICTINEANMRLQIGALMERFKKQMMAKMAENKAGENEGKDAQESMEGQVQVGLNLSNPMEKMKLAAIENAKVFGDPQPHTFVSATDSQGDEIVIKAHLAAKEAIKSINSEINVGITLSLHDCQSIPGGEDKAKKEWDEEFAHYVPFIKDDDFFGLQNYTRTMYGPDGIVPVSEGTPMTLMDYEVYPEALENVIRRVNEEMPGVPILVTENGIATADDSQRVNFIDVALRGVYSCIVDGIPVIGYCHWSLLDNFEWQKGYALTFGLCAVDRTTQTRFPKPSLKHLGNYI